MLKELLLRNPKDKIIAICLGLIIVSSVLLIVFLTGLNEIVGIIILDNYFFGVKIKLFFLYYIVDIIILLAIIYTLQRKIIFGIYLGIFWSMFNLLENIYDIPIFISDPHLIFEELVFIFLYAYLLLLFIVNYKHSLVSNFKQELS